MMLVLRSSHPTLCIPWVFKNGALATHTGIYARPCEALMRAKCLIYLRSKCRIYLWGLGKR